MNEKKKGLYPRKKCKACKGDQLNVEYSDVRKEAILADGSLKYWSRTIRTTIKCYDCGATANKTGYKFFNGKIVTL